MVAEYRIIDADGHVMELDEQLREYIGPPFNQLEWHRSYSFWPGLTSDGFLRSLRAPGGWAGGGRVGGQASGRVSGRVGGRVGGRRVGPMPTPGPAAPLPREARVVEGGARPRREGGRLRFPGRAPWPS